MPNSRKPEGCWEGGKGRRRPHRARAESYGDDWNHRDTMIAFTLARSSMTRWRRCIGRKTDACRSLGDDRLKGTQGVFGFDPDKIDEEQAVRFAELRGSDLKSARAWAIKEVIRRFWSYSDEGSARKLFQEWYGWARRGRLQPMIKVAKRLKRHFENFVTSLRHPITNAVTEGLSSKIPAIKANVRVPGVSELPHPHPSCLRRARSLPNLMPEEALQRRPLAASLRCRQTVML